MSAQIVVITGCSKGIGQGISLTLAKDPQRRFKVYATMRNIATNQEDTKTKAGSYYDDTLFIRELDVTKQETIDKTIKDIFEEEGRIDVLINNAGIARPAWWQTAPMETFYDVMDVNYFGCVRMTKAVAPIMKAQRSGKILQISSVMGFKAVSFSEQYTASKFALEGFSESIAPPLRKFNVWVSIIEPGFVLTPMIKLFGNDANSIIHAIIDSWIDCPEEDVTITRKMLTENPDIVFGTGMQSIDDIAKLVENAILSPKPDFRYQSSETVKEFARQRFVDPSGNEIMNSWLKQ
ncbi:retinol dehydrogenase 8-like [Amphiura filiformis]|uniref:retinol dehydrogenase 8-like n=1 Tax=Amphiura filiformis TaxID=82378 RepID=UPI003B20D666